MEETRDVDLKEVISYLLKKWWLILLLITLGFGAAYFMTDRYITPIYEARTVLFIGNEDAGLGTVDISLGQLNADSQLIVDYQQIALTRLVIEEVINNLGLKISYEEFCNYVVVETVEQSRLFTVGFRYPDPRIAKSVSDELAQQLSLAVFEIVGVENVRVLDQARIPEYPISPNKFKNALLGSFLGLIASLAIIITLFLLDDTIKNEEDIESLIGITVLGTIPRMKGKA